MSWWETLPTLGIALLVYAIPGLALLLAAGVRGLTLAALTGPVTSTVVACAGVVFGYTHIPFNPLTIAILTALLTAAIIGIRALLKARGSSVTALEPQHNGPLTTRTLGTVLTRLIIPLAIILPALFITYRYIKGFGTPDAFSETFDNIYHLNAVRFIADTQSANTLTIGNLTEASKGMYPVGMHSIMALVFMLGAPTVTVAVNWGTIIIGALIWPLSCVFLASRIIGMRPLGLLATGAISAGFSGFPYLMIGWGILYPNHAALAILPAVLALFIEATGVRGKKPAIRWPAMILFIVTVPGLALTHPSAFVALLAFGSPVILAVAFQTLSARRRRIITPARTWVFLGLAAVYFVVTLVIWIKVRPSLDSAGWTGFQTNARAVGEILTSAPMGTTIAWAITVLTLAGLYAIARNFARWWWVAGTYAVAGLLYAIVSAWPAGPFRDFMTGVWYADSFRLAALLPTATIPVAAIGADWLLGSLHGWLLKSRERITSAAPETPEVKPALMTRLAGSVPARAAGVVPVVIALALGVISQGGTLSIAQQRIESVFKITPDNALVSTDELALIKQLPDLMPKDQLLVGNARTGASLAYAFTGIKVLTPHIFGVRSDDEQYLINHWDEAAYNPRICPLIKEKNAFYALDFGDRELFPRAEPLEGTADLATDSAPGMQLIKAVGQARLFKVTACG